MTLSDWTPRRRDVPFLLGQLAVFTVAGLVGLAIAYLVTGGPPC